MRHRRPYIVLSLVVLIASLAPPLPAMQKTLKRRLSEQTSLIEINPRGRPMHKEREQALLIWQDDDGWHLRGHGGSGKRQTRFEGTIEVIDGRVTRLWGTQGLETTGAGVSDYGEISKDKKTIRFLLQITNLGEDGFDFQVGPTTTHLRLSVLVNKFEHPERIRIGAASQPAPGPTFVLPVKSQ